VEVGVRLKTKQFQGRLLKQGEKQSSAICLGIEEVKRYFNTWGETSTAMSMKENERTQFRDYVAEVNHM
jgi:hypothetical protein